MIRHHPADDLLLSLAAGTLSIGATLVVRTHIETCTRCQERLGLFEAVGGITLEDLPPASLSPQALARTLATIDRPVQARPTAASRTFDRGERPSLPAGMAWPRALEACTSTPGGFSLLACGGADFAFLRTRMRSFSCYASAQDAACLFIPTTAPSSPRCFMALLPMGVRYSAQVTLMPRITASIIARPSPTGPTASALPQSKARCALIAQLHARWRA